MTLLICLIVLLSFIICFFIDKKKAIVIVIATVILVADYIYVYNKASSTICVPMEYMSIEEINAFNIFF